METIQETARIVTSKTAQRAVVNTILLVSGAVSLFCLAAVASALFFQNFVPDQFVTTPVHLQYGSSNNPYGVAALSVPLLKSQQDYDISVTLAMPRSPPNVERGNFMVSLYLLGSKNSDETADSARDFANGRTEFEKNKVIYKSRRPALIPYVDPVVSLASRILFVFYHLLVPTSHTCTMRISLGEKVIFTKDSTIPTTAYVEVEAGQSIQIYNAALTMTAQLSGLRWLMFHYRLPTYFAFTSLFWLCELTFMSVAWIIWGSTASSSPPDKLSQKGQGKLPRQNTDDDLDDTDGFDGDDQSDYPQSFPTYGKQPALKHEPEVKKEEDTERDRPLSEIPVAGADADDEDEDAGDRSQRDSGIGTSYSEEGGGGIRKRASRGHLQ